MIKFSLTFLIVSFFCLSGFSTSMDSYLVELGEYFLEKDYTQNAETEFKKALMVNPDNQQAKQYLEDIRKYKVNNALDELSPSISYMESAAVNRSTDNYSASRKKQIMLARRTEDVLSSTESKPVDSFKPTNYYNPIQLTETSDKIETPANSSKTAKSASPIFLTEKSDKNKTSDEEEENLGVKVSGEFQTSFGIDSEGDFIWKRANWDLNELDWRLLSTNAYDNRANTYDPAIYTRLMLELDGETDEDSDYTCSFHAKFDLSPWSFVGKSDKVKITGMGASDSAEVQLLYWAATGYTVNQTVYTLVDGAGMAIPEIKVEDGKTVPTTLESTWTAPWSGAYFELPELKIKREFWPLRELWVDFKTENTKLRIFPAALEDQALTSDDSLGISNHKIFWEESPWLDAWAPGHFNDGSGAQDFFKGYWDDSLSWFTRDSRGVRLTNLRGVSFSWFTEDTDLDFTVASPKTLWQDYESFNSYAAALRVKQRIYDNLQIGTTDTIKLGYDENSLDALSHTSGIDVEYGLSDNTKVSLEVAASMSEQDRTTSYQTEKRGNAVKFSLINSSQDDIFGKNYFGIIPKRNSSDPFYRLRLEFTHMDEGFEAALSNYKETRDDMFWSRHIHFGQPFKYYYSGLYQPTLNWYDIEPARIGDGIDYGRDVIGFRVEGVNSLDGKFDWLFDTRNVHLANGQYFENVSRFEYAYRVIPKFTAKFLGIYHNKPKTTEGIDPFVFDAKTGQTYINNEIEEGKDPSLATISLGGEYKLTRDISFHGIWEHTNDSTVAYDNFPRAILRDTSFDTYSNYGMTFREQINFLYGQENFPQPPYPFFNIFKAGIDYQVFDKLRVGIDWTKNDYKFAGQIDSNINHTGIEIEYFPSDKLSFYFKYVYSKWNDINRILYPEGDLCQDHHNFFFETKYQPTSSDEIIFQYGVFTKGEVGELLFDPYGGTLSVLDTQHIFRIFYRKTF